MTGSEYARMRVQCAVSLLDAPPILAAHGAATLHPPSQSCPQLLPFHPRQLSEARATIKILETGQQLRCRYQLLVKTGNVKASGTDSRVFVRLNGEAVGQTSGDVHVALPAAAGGSFARGSLHSVEVGWVGGWYGAWVLVGC